jgi:hypothetical protein
MIGGTAVQTVLLAYLTVRCDWDEEVGISQVPCFVLARNGHAQYFSLFALLICSLEIRSFTSILFLQAKKANARMEVWARSK